MRALTGKIAAVYVQEFDDGVALASASSAILILFFFLADAFKTEGDRDIVADTTQHFVHAEFAALDRELGKESGSLPAERPFACSHQSRWQYDGSSLTKNSQIGGNQILVVDCFNTGRLQFNFGKLLHVEKIGSSADVRPALRNWCQYFWHQL